jgi:hypothetical protein
MYLLFWMFSFTDMLIDEVEEFSALEFKLELEVEEF